MCTIHTLTMFFPIRFSVPHATIIQNARAPNSTPPAVMQLRSMVNTVVASRNIKCTMVKIMGRDSSVGIATCYGLDGPGTGSRWGRDFSAPVQTGPGAYPASYTMGTVSFPGVKRPGHGIEHPHPSSIVVEGRVELYICSPSEPSWPVLG
jgi:hypothetical protein